MTVMPGSARLATKPGKYETGHQGEALPSVEQLVRDAHCILATAGIAAAPSRVAKLARRYDGSPAGFADWLLSRAGSTGDNDPRVYLSRWVHPDRTGDTAARHVMRGAR